MLLDNDPLHELELLNQPDYPKREAAKLNIGSDIEIAERVREDLERRWGELVYTEGKFWRYGDTHWLDIPEHFLRLATHQYDGALFNSSAGKTASVKLNKSRVDSVLHEMAAGLTQSQFFQNKDGSTGINCSNGFIQLAADGMPQLTAHHPDHRCRHTLPGHWHPTALAVPPPQSMLYRLLTLKNHSRIEAAYLESDQRQYYVPCLHCGDLAPITWARIQWPEGRRDQAYLICEQCGGIHQEYDKPRLLAGGVWRATAQGDGRTAGFHLSALYSPWESWGEIALEHGQVYRDPPRLQVWTNTKLGESWEDMAGEAVAADPLLARRENWQGLLPAGIAALTAGVDVQGDRIEVQVIGWGMDEEAWVVDYRVIWGDPSGPRIWQDLDTFLKTTYAQAGNLPDMPIRAACIDTGGHHTKMAYEFCRTRLVRRIWAIKGRGGAAVPVWPRRPTRIKGKVPLFIVGVDAVKDALFARLRLTENGPGFVHFSLERDMEYFRQLTAERVVTRFERGRPIRSWQLRREGERNEALDTFVYASAALHGLISMGLRLNDEAASLPTATASKTISPLPATIKSNWMR